LVPLLLENDYAVTVVDRFDGGGPELAWACQYESFTPIRGDARNAGLLGELVPRHDILLPLAGLVGAPLCAEDRVGAETINRDAVVSLVKLASKSQRIVFPTTNSGYGVGGKDTDCDETTPLNPISIYGRTKVEAEKAVLDSGNGITLRLATVFGMAPRMRIDLLVNEFVQRAVSDRAVVVFEGHFRRNYIHIRDVAKAFLHVTDNYARMNGEPYNVGLSDANLTKLQLCERIKAHIPSFAYVEAKIGEDPDKRDYTVSNAKIEATGFRPDWSLDRGIAELIKGFCMMRVRKFSNV
jgi:nucleoside-diphosphate-sugar epimerase